MIRLASVFFAGFGIVTACGSSESEAPSGSGGVAGGGAVGGGAGVANSDGASGASAARVGDPCTSVTVCPAGGSGTPVCLTDWPGGYCAIAACTDHGHDCPEDPGLGNTATTVSVRPTASQTGWARPAREPRFAAA